jgi:predicted DNA-binding transcriptional regulator AlpA
MTSEKSAPAKAPAAPLDIDALAAALAPELAEVLAHRVADLLADRLTAQIRGIAALGDNAILKPAEAAAALGKSEPTLELWRARGNGPRAIKLGVRSVGYRLADLKAYIAESARVSLEGRPVEDGEALPPCP